MKNTETISSNSARCHRTKPFRTSAALTLATFMLVVVAATTAATAQTYTVLYNFGSKNGDPNGPYQNVIAQGRDGSMYSTTADQWTGGAGEVFKITPEGILTVLHKFNGADGQSPHGGLTLAIDGNFYGTTASGGSSGYGTIFRITPGGKLTTLYNFYRWDGRQRPHPSTHSGPRWQLLRDNKRRRQRQWLHLQDQPVWRVHYTSHLRRHRRSGPSCSPCPRD
jgi:uncharacterized repeat protein (TIGR03803 family)